MSIETLTENDRSDLQRRTLLQLAAAGMAAAGTSAPAAPPGTSALPAATGKPGDFDFLTGEWKIQNRQLQKSGHWEAFEGEATVHGLLAGVCSVEELRIPSRQFSGMGLRLLDLKRGLWADHWVNGKSGVLTPPPSWGSFVDGVGTWDAAEEEDGQPVIYRGVWDQITPRSCRWYQAVSRDAGRTWQQNWVMHWARG